MMAMTPIIALSSTSEMPVKITIDASSPTIKPINQGINDFSFFQGSKYDDKVLKVIKDKGDGYASLVRMQANLDEFQCDVDAFPAEFIESLNKKIDNIYSLGSKVLLTFHGSPLCISRRPSTLLNLIFGWNDGLQPPKSGEAYGAIVEQLLRILTTDRINDGKMPITHVQTWTEPDFFIWYRGYWNEFIRNIFIPSGLAIQTIEQETGLDLQFYTSSTSSMLPSFFAGSGQIDYKNIQHMVSAADQYQFDLEGIAWNYYASYPFIGVKGGEFSFPGPINSLVAFFLQRVNPISSAKLYHNQITTLKALHPNKKLILTEWNIVVGGEDVRTHNNEGAALIASTLSAMQDSDLDYAHVFSAHMEDEFYQLLHGMINADGTTDHRWSTLSLWEQLGKDQIAIEQGVNESHHDVWSTATRHENGDISILIANYKGVPRYSGYELNIRINNFYPLSTTVDSHWIEPEIEDYAGPIIKELEIINDDRGSSINISMKNQSLVFIHLKNKNNTIQAQ